MPKLVTLDGVDIYMYFKDHAPPHVHAFYGDDEALVVVRDGSIYAGALPTQKLALVRVYLAENVVDLLARWSAYGGA